MESIDKTQKAALIENCWGHCHQVIDAAFESTTGRRTSVTAPNAGPHGQHNGLIRTGARERIGAANLR